ncbi:uncharacterized protein LOC122534948 [Frieseomelitta varia]|uniref:uncharacterized protein LOC122534948 n=1 Tax=Frieseomelitta varia TaxID=561572 RepID=UPI001CB6A105|nr:uncharacterized protein LOC122534948 [Frieseomelitta varia]
MRSRLIESALQLRNNKSLLEKRLSFPQICSVLKYSASSEKNKTKNDDDVDDYDKPYKFSTSKAAKLSARYTSAEARNKPFFQPTIIALSLAVFFIYFGILREENDIDEAMIKNMDPAVVEHIYGKQKNVK